MPGHDTGAVRVTTARTTAANGGAVVCAGTVSAPRVLSTLGPGRRPPIQAGGRRGRIAHMVERPVTDRSRTNAAHIFYPRSCGLTLTKASMGPVGCPSLDALGTTRLGIQAGTQV